MICLILIVRDEAGILGDNLAHHLRQGVDRILVIDNGSTDGTRDLLADAARDGMVEVIPWASDTFEQQRMAHALVLAAAERGASWVLPNDADEFWSGTGGATLRDVLDGCGTANVLQAQRINMVGDRDALATQDWRQVLQWRMAAPVPRAMALSDVRVPLSHPYFYMALPPKVAFRTAGYVEIATAGHRVRMTAPHVRADLPLRIRHFPIRDRDEFAASVRRRATQVLGPGWPAGRSTQYRRWAEMTLRSGSIAAAFAETLPDAARLAADIASGVVVREDTADLFPDRTG